MASPSLCKAIWIAAAFAAAIGGVSLTGLPASHAATDGATARLSYSALLGGRSVDEVAAVDRDAEGNIYVAGHTSSKGLSTKRVIQRRKGAKLDAFVLKMNRSGRRVLFFTYLGGRGLDYASDLEVGESGDVYLTGWTFSDNFPTTPGAFKRDLDGSDPGEGWIARLRNDGRRLRYSTYLGGSQYENPYGLAVDDLGQAHLVGVTASGDFPTQDAVRPALMGLTDAFVTVLSDDGSDLVFSTFFGGEGLDQASDVVVDDSGAIYMAGGTTSKTFPTESAAQPIPGTTQDGAFAVDAFVSKFTREGDVAYSTYVGGNRRDFGRDLALREDGTAVVTGETRSDDFPIVDAFQDQHGGEFDIFVTELSPSGEAFVYSTYVGGSATDSGWGIDIEDQSVAVVGSTASTDFDLIRPLQSRKRAGSDAVFTVFGEDRRVEMSTYYGGNAADVAYDVVWRKGSFLAGLTSKSDRLSKQRLVGPGSPRGLNAVLARVIP